MFLLFPSLSKQFTFFEVGYKDFAFCPKFVFQLTITSHLHKKYIFLKFQLYNMIYQVSHFSYIFLETCESVPQWKKEAKKPLQILPSLIYTNIPIH